MNKDGSDILRIFMDIYYKKSKVSIKRYSKIHPKFSQLYLFAVFYNK